MRMLIIYSINLGILDWHYTKIAISNSLFFCIILGPIIGWIALNARDKKLKIKIIKKTPDISGEAPK
jgi:hypothetical protein